MSRHDPYKQVAKKRIEKNAEEKREFGRAEGNE